MYNSKVLGRHGIKFGGRDSRRDMELILTDADIGSVQLKTVDVNIPYNNRPLSFDFSQICGEPIYQPRKLRFEFAMTAPTARIWQDRYRDVCAWLMRQPRSDLYFDVIRDYHFTARCDSVSIEQMYNDHTGRFTATFTANPMMISEDYADTPWDLFSFSDDCMNKNKIAAFGTQTIQFYSYANHDIIPRLSLVTSSGQGGRIGYVELNGKQLPAIERNDRRWFRRDDFVVKPGKNTLRTISAGKLLYIDLTEEVL